MFRVQILKSQRGIQAESEGGGGGGVGWDLSSLNRYYFRFFEPSVYIFFFVVNAGIKVHLW